MVKMTQGGFHILDYVLFSVVILCSIGIGLFYAFRGKRTASEFLSGSKDLKLIPVAISILVSRLSSILVIGFPADVYVNGFALFLYNFGLILGTMAAVYIYVPLLYPLQLTSSLEYVRMRYKSLFAKAIAAIAYTTDQMLYISLVLLGPSIAMKAALDIPLPATIVASGCVVILYTCLGGLTAVIWTDVLQATIMLAGMLATLIIGIVRVGGLERVWQIDDDWGRNNLDDPGLVNFDPRQSKSIWSLMFIQSLVWMEMFGSDQTSYQRYVAMRTIRQARWSIILSMFGAFAMITIACVTGMVVFAYYADQGCDPLSASPDSNSNEIIPLFVMEVLSYPGLPGLFVASLLSAGLSSVSSSLCAISAVIWDGLIDPLVGHKLSERGKLTVSRIIVVVFGVTGMAFSLVFAHIEGSLFQIALGFKGCILGTTMGLFLFGAFVPWINWKGISAGSIVALSVMLWIMLSANSLTLAKNHLDMPSVNCTNIYANYTEIVASKIVPEPTVISGIQHVYTLSTYWYPLVGFCITAIVASLVSLVTGPTPASEVDPNLTINIFDRFCCCLPKSFRRNLSYRDQDMSLTPVPLDDILYIETRESKSEKLKSEKDEQKDNRVEADMLDTEEKML